MKEITFLTFGGHTWTPKYVENPDIEKCLGCGRCIKICSQGCIALTQYIDEDDSERFIASIKNKEACIGCQACGKACVRGCYTFSSLEV